ncbi:MAG TPA: MFS transporter [Candidatus Avanaerovorax faecigallinarum]|nr:MFS transporter [Candidatus Avanaerovorax faecigallinarum]
MEKRFNLQYAGIHGTYWLYYGVICSFASVFLLDRGYSNTEIGIILAVGSIFAVLLQPIMGDLADRSRRISFFGFMEMMTALLMVLTVFLLVLQKKSGLLMFVYVMAFGWMNIVQPFCNAMNRKLSETGVYVNFGACRAIGSLTYSIMCFFLGSLVEKFGVNVLPVTGEVVLILFMTAIVIVAKSFRRAMAEKFDGTKSAASGSSVENAAAGDEEEINLPMFVKRNKMFLVLCFGVLGLYYTNSVLNTYMAQIAESVGGDNGDIGRIFSILALMEIPTMMFFDRINKRFRTRTLMKFSAVAFVFWILICFLAENVMTLILAQFIQPFSFALFLPSIVRFIDDIMSKGEAVKGQTMFTTTTTMAAVFASLIGGVILDAAGPKMLTLTATCVTAVGAAVVVFSADRVKGHKQERTRR